MDSSTRQIDGELVREVYARFGAAYYYSECLHRGLCNAYAVAPFVNREGITGPRIDERLNEAFSMTLGALVEALRPWTSDELHVSLQDAARRRNFLAHHFWFQRSHLMFSNDTLESLVEELEAERWFFEDVDARAEKHFAPQLAKLGLTNQIFQDALEHVMAGEDWQEIPAQRKLKKVETLLRIWDAPTPAGASTLIFELEDGTLWQVADIGLGWTRFKTPDAAWRENELLKPYLPTSVNPRPGTAGCWQYEFQLAGGARLWIRLSTKRREAFEWGLRRPGSGCGA